MCMLELTYRLQHVGLFFHLWKPKLPAQVLKCHSSPFPFCQLRTLLHHLVGSHQITITFHWTNKNFCRTWCHQYWCFGYYPQPSLTLSCPATGNIVDGKGLRYNNSKCTTLLILMLDIHVYSHHFPMKSMHNYHYSTDVPPNLIAKVLVQLHEHLRVANLQQNLQSLLLYYCSIVSPGRRISLMLVLAPGSLLPTSVAMIRSMWGSYSIVREWDREEVSIRAWGGDGVMGRNFFTKCMTLISVPMNYNLSTFM